MKKIIKYFIALVVLLLVALGFYLYKLHSLAIEGNNIFALRCKDVNPRLIGYKKSFLKMADFFNDPEGNADIDVLSYYKNYNAGLKAYLEEENKWLEMQKAFMNRWDFKLFESWYIKQAADYQWKMYEGYRDDAKYMLAIFDAGGTTEEINSKSTEARNRRDEYEKLYYEFFEKASEIKDWRKIFISLPLPDVCNAENLTIPETSGSINWDEEPIIPSPTVPSADSDLTT